LVRLSEHEAVILNGACIAFSDECGVKNLMECLRVREIP
jgi:hypothetical protein